MRRDAKGRFTKALAKTKPQLPTHVKLERKMARIEQAERGLSWVRLMLALNALFILGCTALIAAGPVVGSIPISVTGAIGFFVRIGDLREVNQRYWKCRATYRRLLRDADSLTTKLLAEEGVSIDI